MLALRLHVVACCAVALFATSSCHRRTKLELRTDLAPIEKRVSLPAGVRGVRWVAVPLFNDSGFLETPDKAYAIYALLDVAPVPSPAARAVTITAPLDVARMLLPGSTLENEGNVELSGTELAAPITPRESRVGVDAAVRLSSGGILLRFTLGS